MGTSPKIVICGAGIAGIAAAYYLAVELGRPDVIIVEEGNPLSLTSDKSTEAYRNWWPGPDRAMTAFMNRSIDLMEEIARATGNRINLNRRGYLFATGDASKVAWLREMALTAEAQGSGPARIHDTPSSPYAPSPERGFDFPLTGADIITDTSLIRRHFPYLTPETVAVAHARRAGWLSAQQLGMAMLEAARERGVRLMRGKVVGVDTGGGRIRSVHVEQQGERQTLEATHLVLAAGPMLKETARLHRRRAADRRRAPPEDQPPRQDRRSAARGSDADLARRAASALERRRARRPRRETKRHAGCCASFPRASTGARTAAAPARRCSSSSTTTTAPRTSSFPCRTSRTTRRSRCAACRPWCRRSRLTSTAGRGRTSTAATTSRRARTGR